MSYAGFWKRFAAAFIDLLITAAIGGFAVPIVGLLYAASTGTVVGAEFAGLIAGALVKWIYSSTFESSAKQATLGKMALGIKVTNIDGTRIGFGTATLRHFGKIVSFSTLFIGYIMVAFTEKKQGLHDKIAGCLVVNKSEGNNCPNYATLRSLH